MGGKLYPRRARWLGEGPFLFQPHRRLLSNGRLTTDCIWGRKIAPLTEMGKRAGGAWGGGGAGGGGKYESGRNHRPVLGCV